MICYINFVRDYYEMLTNALKDKGHNSAHELDPIKRFALLFDNDARKVEEKIYEILISRELLNKKEWKLYNSVLEEIIDKLGKGDSINPYLSTRVERIKHLDKLLLHWGINHLHLEGINTKKASGFVQRADDLLFFRVQEGKFYLIDILPHPHDPVEWADVELVRIVDRNWPHLHHLLNGVVDLEREITSSNYARLREANINTVVKTERGVVSPTFGVMCSGHSGDSIRVFDHTVLRLRKLEYILGENRDKLFPEIAGYVTWLTLARIEEDGFVVHDGCSDKLIFLSNTEVDRQ